jgi:hypothetical protein
MHKIPINDMRLPKRPLHNQHQNINSGQELKISTNSHAKATIILIPNEVLAQRDLDVARGPEIMTTLKQRCRQDFRKRIASFERLLDDTQDGHDIADIAVVEEAGLAG